jgi:hypothetical protein
VFANSQSVKNSLQWMKHDIKKNGSSSRSTTNLSKRRFSTITDQTPAPYDDEDDEH